MSEQELIPHPEIAIPRGIDYQKNMITNSVILRFLFCLIFIFIIAFFSPSSYVTQVMNFQTSNESINSKFSFKFNHLDRFNDVLFSNFHFKKPTDHLDLFQKKNINFSFSSRFQSKNEIFDFFTSNSSILTYPITFHENSLFSESYTPFYYRVFNLSSLDISISFRFSEQVNLAGEFIWTFGDSFLSYFQIFIRILIFLF